MEIEVPFGFQKNFRNFLQRCGYSIFIDPYSRQESYSKRLSRDFYPRFHLYLKEKEGKIILNLHLDQKKPSYAGAHAHSGEYEGEVVEKETERLKGLIKNQIDNQEQKVHKIKKEDKGLFSWLFK